MSKMIAVGAKAPAFSLPDHLGRTITLDQFAGKRNVMLLFYPLDFTPTWTQEIPAVERLLDRFRSAHTQVLGVSVDSIFSHANWAQSMGGISFPLLADFHPKGAMATKYGLYLGDNGITDRATVIIDSKGVVRHASSVTPSGKRNIEELANLCASIDREHGGGLAQFAKPKGVEKDAIMFVKNNCGASRAAMLARRNLHLDDTVPLRNVSEDAGARADLEKIAGKDEAPCLVVGGKPIHDSKAIVGHLVNGATDIPG